MRREIRRYVEKSERAATLADVRDYAEQRRADRSRLTRATATDVRREGAPTLTASVPSSLLSATIDGAPIFDDEIGSVSAEPMPEAPLISALNDAVLSGDVVTADLLRTAIRRIRVARPATAVTTSGARFYGRADDAATATGSDVVVREASTVRRLSGAMVDHASHVEMLMLGVLTAVARGKGETRRIEWEISPMLGGRAYAGGVPYSYGYAVAWEYVARTCMGTRFEATILRQMIDNPRARGFAPSLSDRDDAAQDARADVADLIARWMARTDTVAHLSCDCGRCDDAEPLFPRGPVAWSAERMRRCGDCEGCEIELDPNPWNVRQCVTPVASVDHVNLARLTGRAVRTRVAEYMRARLRRTISATPSGDDLTAIADAQPSRVSDVLDSVPSDVAQIMTTIIAATTLTGDDVTGRTGALSARAATALAITCGYVTRDATGQIIDATPMQRRLALAAIRSMIPARSDVLPADDDPACYCRWNVATGRLSRRCAGHGGGTVRWLSADANRVWIIDPEVILRDQPSNGSGRAPSGGHTVTVGTPSESASQWCACDRC